MNRAFRIVWNKALACWVVAHELARTHGQPSLSMRALRRQSAPTGPDPSQGDSSLCLRPVALTALALSVALVFCGAVQAQPRPGPAPNELPAGARVAAGAVNITQSPNAMVVQQGTDKAIVNWQSFNVGSQASVRFDQPSSSSAILNRVESGQASQIQGRISANGQVFLLNPNGVLFSKDAQVDVGALVAGAMKITDANFLAGKYEFTDGQGIVTNQGRITAADAGLIALLAPEVRNEGIIRARLGTIVLAAGQAITLTNAASGVTVVVDQGVMGALIENRHLVSAEDGRVFMSARAGDALQRAVINNSGTIEARGARRIGGVLRLEAGRINNTGTLDASAAPASSGDAPSRGGQVEIKAAQLTNSGLIAASGDAGGAVTVQASDLVHNDGAIEARGMDGPGGNVLISAPRVVQTPKARTSVASTRRTPPVAQESKPVTAASPGPTAASTTASAATSGSASAVVTTSGAVASVAGAAGTADSPPATLAASAITGSVPAVEASQGRVTITAGSVALSGVIDASSAETMGGHIEIGSATTQLTSAVLDVSGAAGGGRIDLRVRGEPAPSPVPAAAAVQPTPAPAPSDSPLRSSLVLSGSTLRTDSRRGRGGELQLFADEIRLVEGTSLSASGALGGGTILIGGGWQGAGDTAQAKHVVVDASTSLEASATVLGDGGMIVAWSDIRDSTGLTEVRGSLIARGGTLGGDGGKLETSGHVIDVAEIRVDTRAPVGRSGEWLIDPYNITIAASGASGTAYSNSFTAGATSTILAGSIESALNAGTNVSINTGTIASPGSDAGHITVNAPIAKTAGASALLTLTAARRIDLNANITSTSNALNLALNAEWVNVKNITTTGVGTLTVTAGNTAVQGNVVTTGAQSYSGNLITVGDVALNSNGTAITVTGMVGAPQAGTLQFTGDGGYVFNGTSYTAGSASSPFGVAVSYNSTSKVYSWYSPVATSSAGVLLVGGGGGAGSTHGGGGGGGGFIETTAQALDLGGFYAIVVGAGGRAALAARPTAAALGVTQLALVSRPLVVVEGAPATPALPTASMVARVVAPGRPPPTLPRKPPAAAQQPRAIPGVIPTAAPPVLRALVVVVARAQPVEPGQVGGAVPAARAKPLQSPASPTLVAAVVAPTQARAALRAAVAEEPVPVRAQAQRALPIPGVAAEQGAVAGVLVLQAEAVSRW